jgi:ABC-2 type transport system permease protein
VRLMLRHTRALTVRQLLALWRQPWFAAITLVQPMIWLLLFGALFKRVIEIPGFKGGSYIDFLTPGIVVMSALFSAGWHGMGWINAIDRGIVDRFLVSPVSRVALIAAGVAQQIVIILIQSLIIVGVAAALGAELTVARVVVMLVAASFLGGAICALSDGRRSSLDRRRR